MDNATGEITPVMITAWEPTPKEFEALQRGEPVYLCIIGSSWPPVLLTVGEPEGMSAPEA